MKKTMLMIGIFAMLTVGTAFGAENQGNTLYNGVTYFAPAAPATAAVEQETSTPYNGITVFNVEQPRTEMSVPCVQLACAGKSTSYNGITVF